MVLSGTKKSIEIFHIEITKETEKKWAEPL